MVGTKDWCLSAVCEMAAMSKVVAYRGATDAVGACICGCRSVLGDVSTRGELMLLLLEQVVVPVVLLPLCVHGEHR